jgi:ElaB/YqjD/DUF883 family membrane-anchored ribosome-binding protein
MVMEHTSIGNITEALKLLEEAAKHKKDELMTAMSDKYTHLRSLTMGNGSTLIESLTTAKDRAIKAATHARDVSVEKARDVAHGLDQNVHRNPWAYLAGTAAVALVLGYVLGRSRK